MTTPASVFASTIPWARLHALTETAALANCAVTGSVDRWGGSGVSSHVSETLLGLAELYGRAVETLHEAWKLCQGHQILSESDFEKTTVYEVRDGKTGATIVKFNTHAQARRAMRRRERQGRSVYILGVEAIDSVRRGHRLARQTDHARSLIQYVFAASALYVAVTEALGGKVPEHTICCEDRYGNVSISGPSWWAGLREDFGHHHVSVLKAFVETGDLNLLRNGGALKEAV